MDTKTKKRSYHTDMASLISKLTMIMFLLVPLMETQKHLKKCIAKLAKVNSKIERSHSWHGT